MVLPRVQVEHGAVKALLPPGYGLDDADKPQVLGRLQEPRLQARVLTVRYAILVSSTLDTMAGPLGTAATAADAWLATLVIQVCVVHRFSEILRALTAIMPRVEVNSMTRRDL